MRGGDVQRNFETVISGTCQWDLRLKNDLRREEEPRAEIDVAEKRGEME